MHGCNFDKYTLLLHAHAELSCKEREMGQQQGEISTNDLKRNNFPFLLVKTGKAYGLIKCYSICMTEKSKMKTPYLS